MKLPKSRLDEMQEKKITKAESIGFEIAVIGLFLAIFFQGIIEIDFSMILGEFVMIEALCVYGGLSYFRNGVWDRFLAPGMKSYLLVSFVAGTLVAGYVYILAAMTEPAYSIAVDMLLAFFLVFLFNLLTSIAFSKLYKKRREKLDGNSAQKELAAKVNVSSATIRAIEEGTYDPSISLCREICRVTGKTLDELFWTNDVNCITNN